MENLVCNERKISGKDTRKKGNIPGIIYGKDISNLLFEISELELNKEIKKNGEHGVVNINLNNKNYKTIIKQIQRHPVNHKVMHIDLENLSGDDKIQLQVPLVFSGEENIIKNGGVIQKEKESITIKCNSDKIPNSFSVDLSKFEIGDTYRLADIEVSQDIFLTEDLDTVIASIVPGNYKKDVEEDVEE